MGNLSVHAGKVPKSPDGASLGPMLIYAGIDEAGYGPMLGPLCIGAATFILPDADPAEGAPDLWSQLSEAICRKVSDKKKRIAVNDSKLLKGASGSKAHPSRHLERGVVSFLGALDRNIPSSDIALFERVGVSLPEEQWYAGDQIPLPLDGTLEARRISASVLNRALRKTGIQLDDLACETIHPHQINAAANRRERKSSLNLAGALRLADGVRRRHPDKHPRVVIDRQGGRQSYREQLALAWPNCAVRILGETPRISRYRLEFAEGPLTISFEAESESANLPAALASMTAKLVRELHMMRLNRFFGVRVPELKPTAGYVQDGRRFMQDVDPVCRELKLDESQLVRSV